MSPDLIRTLVVGAVGGLVSIVVAVVGYLVKRQIDGVDNHLSAQDGHLSRQDGKLDSLATKWSEHDRALAVLDLRMSHLEAGDAVRRTEHSQFAGFLQTLGFRRADPPREGT